MTTFTDNTGRKWDYRVPYSKRHRLLELGIDLTKPWEAVPVIGDWIESDLDKLVNVAFEIASHTYPKVTLEEFMDAVVGGDALLELSRCTAGAVIDFFPNPAVRQKILEVLRGIQSTDRPSTSTESSSNTPGSPTTPETTASES